MADQSLLTDAELLEWERFCWNHEMDQQDIDRKHWDSCDPEHEEAENYLFDDFGRSLMRWWD